MQLTKEKDNLLGEAIKIGGQGQPGTVVGEDRRGIRMPETGIHGQAEANGEEDRKRIGASGPMKMRVRKEEKRI